MVYISTVKVRVSISCFYCKPYLLPFHELCVKNRLNLIKQKASTCYFPSGLPSVIDVKKPLTKRGLEKKEEE